MEVAWNDRSDTGIQVIDEQHRELFRVVERLRLAVQGGMDWGTVQSLVEQLVACSERHFATEETCMSRFGYPDLAQHQAEHASMLESLRELLLKVQGSDQTLVLMAPTFMEGWLRHHISDGDFGFLTFLKSRDLV